MRGFFSPILLCISYNFRVQEEMLAWDELKPVLEELNGAIESCDHENLHKLLIQIVPDFKPQYQISDILYELKSDGI
ncbi:hypothetical protein OAM64_01565 [Candidatus Thioglobus sp.]|jgi:FlaA1/EpsC-like NDP-sugar epimerase|nr:hypothetical protein [Candidatus Thioglobus sp.]